MSIEANPNIFSFDAERTRLVEPTLLGHWAVGAVVMRPDRVVVEEFAGMVDPAALKVNKFVEEQVVPYVHLPEYVSREDMLNAFWDFWMDHGGNRAIAVADFGAPVEGTLFAAAQALDLDRREYAGPYPLHELGTRLLDAGIDPDVNRIAFAGQGNNFTKHDPRDDAIVAAHCWFNAGDRLRDLR
ncbi:MAG TPA: hypothetical protein VFZ58_00900 [Candidatus Saccharimonadales bacterium]